jgi:hypothetical protein
MVSLHSPQPSGVILEEAGDVRMARLVGDLADRGPATRVISRALRFQVR